MPRRLALAIALFLATSAHAHVFPARLPPIDQCKAKSGLATFRDRLKQVAAKHDRKALLAVLAPDVLVNFGGEAGPRAFADAWGLNGTSDSELWPLLHRMLKLGCAGSGESFVIPSFTDQLDIDSAEEVEDKMLVSAPGAKLRKSSEARGGLVATLAWDVVTAVDRSGEDQTKVRLADGREGWLFDDELYGALDYRMVIEKRRGKWMITALVAGD
jgi:hypothetical protein